MKRIASDKIDAIAPNEVFVFGSNLEGKHISGAAKAARERFGAVWGCGDGYQGQSYAIPTMHGGPEAIAPYVDRFIIFAKTNPQLRFLVTRIGCGIAGFKDEEIAPLFIDAIHVDNIYLPTSFWDAIEAFMPQPYTRFMRMIAELHKRGHELLRLCPSVSPNGCAWRAVLTPRSNTWVYCGAMVGNYDPGEGLLVRSSGSMPWFGNFPAATASEDADLFIRTYPILAAYTKGEDHEYVRWFLKALDECEHGHIIYTMDDWKCCLHDGYIYGGREPFCYPPAGECNRQEQY